MAKKTTTKVKLKKSDVQELCAQFNNTCALCEEGDASIVETHHIVHKEEGGSDHIDNLINLCPNCHTKYHQGKISREVLFKAKLEAVKGITKPVLGKKEKVIIKNSGNNSGIMANNIIADQLNVKTHKPRGVRANIIIPGAISADIAKWNYCEYLRKMYYEFKEKETHDKTNYALFNKAINREFGMTMRNIPIERFEELVVYLQGRIDKTIHGKMNKRFGSNYLSFREYCAKHIKKA